jgi:hypothetical protein
MACDLNPALKTIHLKAGDAMPLLLGKAIVHRDCHSANC